ncbi:PAS domain S-box-containing protein [Oleiphilus messinensis]|nr:PAS domain-containing protein [Oceanospirillum linum]SEG26009.1 PAS domain S-box-containing protein [Oleiphilus messinensis]
MSSIARLSLSRSLSFSFRLNLQARMLILLGGFALLLTLTMGTISLNFIAQTLETQMGQQALDVARAVARLPQIQEGLEENDSRKIQPLVEEVRSAIGARFIVVGDENGVRFAHPLPDRIGKKMVGGDNARALESGEEYVSTAIGSLGPSVRGKVPVFSTGQEGPRKVIGIISVGYMLNQVDQVVGHYQTGIWWFSAATVLVSLILAKLISDYFKRAIFGFEPEEIARLFQERNAILQSVREGIIAINPQGDITTFNEAALNIFGLDPRESMLGRNIRDFQANSDLL